MAKHTETPWAFCVREPVSGIPSGESEIPFSIYKELGGCVEPIADICNFPPATKEQTEHQHANAEFIVRAVNSHDDLLAACKAAERLIIVLGCDCLVEIGEEQFEKSGHREECTLGKLQAAIRKAGEGA